MATSLTSQETERVENEKMDPVNDTNLNTIDYPPTIKNLIFKRSPSGFLRQGAPYPFISTGNDVFLCSSSMIQLA